MDKPTLALSIKQPWAWLICKGFKDIENRDWRIGRNPNYGLYKSQKANFRVELPQRIYVHAGCRFDTWALTDFRLCSWMSDSLIDEKTDKYLDQLYKTWKAGAIIGEVTITGCVDKSDSPWFVGKYGFVLDDPVLYDKPITCRGMLGFWKVDPNLIKESGR